MATRKKKAPKPRDLHDADREFIAWLRTALPEDLNAKWQELMDIAWRHDLWKVRAIERELQRRGLAPPWW